MLLDTNYLLGMLLGDRRVPMQVRRVIEKDPRQVSVSAISAWEVMLLHERGVIRVRDQEPSDWFRERISDVGFNEVPVNTDIALLSRSLKFEHQDPADRFIAATAYFLNVPLATSDSQLRRLPWLQIA